MAKTSQSNQYLKYSGMAIQLFVLLGLAAWIGQTLDAKLKTADPYFTIFFILLFSAVFFYKLVKDLGRRDES